MLTIPMSNYYSISQLNNSVTKAGPKAFSMFHFNIRNLQKNLALLEDFLYSLDKRPEILAITVNTSKPRQDYFVPYLLPSHVKYYSNSQNFPPI